MENVCYACKSQVSGSFIFCPHCGVNLRNTGGPTIGSQIGIFLLSFFLPPLGLYPAIKLLRKPDPVAKRTAIIAIVLTITSIAVSIFTFAGFMSYYMAVLQQMNSQIPGF